MVEYKKPINPGSSAIDGSFVYVKIVDVDTTTKTAHVVDQLGIPKTISITRSYGKQYEYPKPNEEWIATRQFGDWILAVCVSTELAQIEGTLPSGGSPGSVLTKDSGANFDTSWQQPAGIPAGSIMAFGGTTAPNGWYLADGSAVSRTANAALFAAIGMPSHTHTQNPHTHTDAGHSHDVQIGNSNGGLQPGSTRNIQQGSGTSSGLTNNGVASISTVTAVNQSTGGGLAHNNLQPYVVLNYIIKY
jgi:microcystin-dependent protein